MKKNRLLVMLGIVLSCLLCNSCKNSPMPSPEPHLPLADVFNYYILKADGTYGGVPLVNLKPESSFITLDRTSEFVGTLLCSPQWEGIKLYCYIPYRISGELPYVTLTNMNERNGRVSINDAGKEDVSATLSGWVRASGQVPNTSGVQCEIDVKCMVDGKELIFKITEIGKDLPI